MAKFKYKALHPSGRTFRGVLEAQHVYDLVQLLEKSNITLLWARESRFLSREFTLFQKMPKSRDVIEFTFQLSQLLKSGVPLLESLKEMETHLNSSPLRDCVVEMIRDVEGGKSLSQALEKYTHIFDEVSRSLVIVGEKTGKLGGLLDEVLSHLKWKESIRQDVTRALRYPLLLASVMGVAIMILLTVLVPQMIDFLSSFGVEIPTSTHILRGTATFLSCYGFWGMGVIVALVFTVKIALRKSSAFQFHFENALLHLPLYRTFLRKQALLGFSHRLAIMLKNGVHILECLKTVRSTMSYGPLREEILSIESQVIAGKSLSSALTLFSNFSPITQRMIKIGEQSGTLGESLAQVHEYYAQDVKNNIERFMTFLEPGLLVVVGSVVTWIVMALFWPLYEVSSHLEGL